MGAVILGKEAIGEAAGWAGSEVTGLFTDNEQVKMLAGMASSFATGKVSNKVDDYFNLSRKPFLSGMSVDDAAKYNAYWDSLENGTHTLPNMNAEDFARFQYGIDRLDAVYADRILADSADDILKVRNNYNIGILNSNIDVKNVNVKSPSDIAKSWQGSELYPGVDTYTDIQLHKGDEIYILESDYEINNNLHSGYATTKDAVLQSGFDSKKLSESLQIKPYLDETAEDLSDIAEYRSKVTKYVINADELTVAYGEKTLANPQYGQGGNPQYFINEIETEIKNENLIRGDSYELHNYQISSDDYFNMTTQAKENYVKMKEGK